MSRRPLAALLIAGLLCPAMPAAADAASRVALLIGVGNYRYAGPLPNPANDARDLAAALAQLGFEVTEAIDLDKRALDDTLRAFVNRVGAADTALVFFAGHGLQVGGQNYLLPVDARLESERDLDFEAIRLDVILRQLGAGRDGKTSIVLLDACRDNPLARNLARSMGLRSGVLEGGLAPVQSGAGAFIAFSTQPGNVARDGAGRNSPFVTALLRHIARPEKTINALMIEVRKDVMAATRGRQVPWDHSALTGEFYFRDAGGLVTGSLRLPGESGVQEERTRRLDEELGRLKPSRP